MSDSILPPQKKTDIVVVSARQRIRPPLSPSPAVQALNLTEFDVPPTLRTTSANKNHEYSVKTRIQLDPVTYNRGMIGGFKQVIQNEGAGALLTGFGPTAAGYFLQGAFKFGGYEFFKQQSINLLGYENASNYRTGVYLASSAAGEFFADIALCPLEATRIRLVSEPTYANGLLGGFTKIARQEGLGAFYAGFGPILFKQ